VTTPLSELVQRALGLDSLARFERGSGLSYSLLQKVAYDERRATPAVARKIANYLRDRSETYSQMADDLDAAADKEEGDAQTP
jgi:hypothetical protein